MSNTITPMIGLLCTLVGLLAPLYMLALVWLIRWDEQPTPADDPYDPSVTVRGDLPRWLRWAQTMDQRYPGGLYEPAIMAALGNGGYWRRIWTSYLWTGHRSRPWVWPTCAASLPWTTSPTHGRLTATPPAGRAPAMCGDLSVQQTASGKIFA